MQVTQRSSSSGAFMNGTTAVNILGAAGTATTSPFVTSPTVNGAARTGDGGMLFHPPTPNDHAQNNNRESSSLSTSTNQRPRADQNVVNDDNEDKKASSFQRANKGLVFFFTWKIDQWLVMIIFLYGIPFLIGSVVAPTCRKFDLADYSINFPFTEKEMFPTWTLVPIVAAPIFLIYAPMILLWRSTASKRGLNQWKELNAWTLVHLMAVGLTLAMINTTKIMGGRLRPDFVSRLRKEGLVVDNGTPMGEMQYPPQFAAGVTYATVCESKYLQDNHDLRDGHLSFPSGHSGTAFAAMVPLCFFLISRLRPFYRESLLRLVICLLPLALAWVVALSRTQDYRYNFSDILAGGLIGVLCSVVFCSMHLRPVYSHGVWALKVPNFHYDGYVQWKLAGEGKNRNQKDRHGTSSSSADRSVGGAGDVIVSSRPLLNEDARRGNDEVPLPVDATTASVTVVPSSGNVRGGAADNSSPSQPLTTSAAISGSGSSGAGNDLSLSSVAARQRVAAEEEIAASRFYITPSSADPFFKGGYRPV